MQTIIINPGETYINKTKIIQKNHKSQFIKPIKLFNFAPLFTLFMSSPYLGLATAAFVLISCGIAYFETPEEVMHRELKGFIKSEIDAHNSQWD